MGRGNIQENRGSERHGICSGDAQKCPTSSTDEGFVWRLVVMDSQVQFWHVVPLINTYLHKQLVIFTKHAIVGTRFPRAYK